MNALQPVDVRAWPSLGACLGEDPELFFPAGRTVTTSVQLARAKAVCARCPVAAECLRFALASGQDYGVWGGTSEEERKVIRRLISSRSQEVPGWVMARAGVRDPRALAGPRRELASR